MNYLSEEENNKFKADMIESSKAIVNCSLRGGVSFALAAMLFAILSFTVSWLFFLPTIISIIAGIDLGRHYPKDKAQLDYYKSWNSSESFHYTKE